MINFKHDDISYMCQYAPIEISDKDVLDQFNYWLKTIKNTELKEQYKKQIIKIAENMGNVHDEINQKVFEQIFNGDTDIENLKQYNLLLETLSSEYIQVRSDENLKYGMSTFMEENDYFFKNDVLEMIDADFKKNGIQSKYIYSFGPDSALNDIYGDYVYIDPYLQTLNKNIEDIKDEYIQNLSDMKLNEIIDLNYASEKIKSNDDYKNLYIADETRSNDEEDNSYSLKR